MQPPNAIREAIAQNGTTLSHDTAQVFRQLYAQHHQESGASKYYAILRNNISYGPHERNVLDVYVPQDTSTHPRCVMSFVPGGGCLDKSHIVTRFFTSPTGNYFASHGMVVVIINYRLVPSVTYPGGSEDIQTTREWIYNNIHKPEYGNGDPEKVVFIGHSAGGMHLATNIYYAAGDALTPLVPPLAGVVYISVPFSYDTSPKNRKGAVRAYYETEDDKRIHSLAPIGLIEASPSESSVLDPKKLPCLFVAFVDSYRARSPRGILPELAIIPEHNHISNVSSIGTEDDVQGRLLREFILKVCLK
ncbi:Alpha/Beta hydrolase protein [Rhodocollybia butyracea]|uniref:Alpha/Beta hydrolase protein n=1 Tax=Rhodocollybia butyracea TaxID=206335 RepID=A0A9P5PIJ1_9AGAR|nr:Alpha/Beta hydrolase protein [Rhodocollybia butyracea]